MFYSRQIVTKKDIYLKCKLLKKLRKNLFLYKKLNTETNTYYYLITGEDIQYEHFKDALQTYHNEMMWDLNQHYHSLWYRIVKKYQIQILP